MNVGLQVAEELQRLGEQVAGEAATLLSSAQDERLHRLLPRIPPVGDRPWSVVLTGPYNTGKSSIAFVLTGDPSIVIDEDVATAETDRYPWKGTTGTSSAVEIVDTPGVRTGDLSHDEIAETAVRDADLVLFIISPSLFDDTIAEYFRHVALELGKLEQMIVVVNKATLLASTPEIREQAVRDVLGPEHDLPLIVSCDAKAALEAESANDPDVRELASRRSNWGAFEAAVEEIVGARASAGRLRKPFDAVLAVADDAQEFLSPSEMELAADDLLARQRQVMAQSRERLSGRFEDVYDRLRQSVANAGESVIASARDGVPQGAAVSDFDNAVTTVRKGLGDKLQVALGDELVALEADGHRVADGPESIRLSAALGAAADPLDPRKRTQSPSLALEELLTSFVQKEGKDLLRRLTEGGDRPGSPMHHLVIEFGHKFKKKFASGEAVRWSRRLNTAIRAATALFQFAQAVNQAVREDQRQASAIAELRAKVSDVSEGLISTTRVDTTLWVAQLYARMLEPIGEAEGQLEAAQLERDRIASGLADLSRRSREALAGRLDGLGADEED
jgi:hypothetical protein